MNINIFLMMSVLGLSACAYDYLEQYDNRPQTSEKRMQTQRCMQKSGYGGSMSHKSYEYNHVDECMQQGGWR